jgi:hypothetical protein
VPDSKTKVAFGEENSLIIISYEGKYYKVTFDPVNGGECKLGKDYPINILDSSKNK